MKEIVAVNGVVKVKILYHSISRRGVFLRVWNDAEPHRDGKGWQSWNPEQLPAIGTILAVPCREVRFRDTISLKKPGLHQVVWGQVEFKRD